MSTKIRNRVRIDAKKFAAYTAAGVAAVATSATANADITFVDFDPDILLEDLDETDGGIGAGVRLPIGDAGSFQLDLFHSVGTTDATTGFALVGGSLFAASSPAIPGVSIAGVTVGAYNYASNVASGNNISALTDWHAASVVGTMAFNAGYANEQFTDPGTGFIAFRFDNGAGFSFGWVQVTMQAADANGVDSPNLNSFTVDAVAWADPNEALAVGQSVPEPGSLAGLALGALGLGAWRRRRFAA